MQNPESTGETCIKAAGLSHKTWFSAQSGKGKWALLLSVYDIRKKKKKCISQSLLGMKRAQIAPKSLLIISYTFWRACNKISKKIYRIAPVCSASVITQLNLEHQLQISMITPPLLFWFINAPIMQISNFTRWSSEKLLKYSGCTLQQYSRAAKSQNKTAS